MNAFERLGIRRVINAHCDLTPLGGSLMHAEVVEAIAEAASWFVDLIDLLKKAGEHIASLVGVEAAFISLEPRQDWRSALLPV